MHSLASSAPQQQRASENSTRSDATEDAMQADKSGQNTGLSKIYNTAALRNIEVVTKLSKVQQTERILKMSILKSRLPSRQRRSACGHTAAFSGGSVAIPFPAPIASGRHPTGAGSRRATPGSALSQREPLQSLPPRPLRLSACRSLPLTAPRWVRCKALARKMARSPPFTSRQAECWAWAESSSHFPWQTSPGAGDTVKLGITSQEVEKLPELKLQG